MSVKVTVRTVRLNETLQAELSGILSQHPILDVQHYADWNFRLISSDILIVSTEFGTGQEVLDALRNFATIKSPILVTYSENDEHLSKLGDGSVEKTFAQRLERALNLVGRRTGENRYTLPVDLGTRSDSPLLETGLAVDYPNANVSTGKRRI